MLHPVIIGTCNYKEFNIYFALTIGYVAHTIIPETIRFTVKNRREAYPNIASVAIGPHGYIVFLCINENSNKLYKARLHNPISDIDLIASSKGSKIICNEGLVWCFGGSSSLEFYPVNPKSDPRININKCRSKAKTKEVLDEYNLSTSGTLANCQERFSKFQKKVLQKYEVSKMSLNQVIFQTQVSHLFITRLC